MTDVAKKISLSRVQFGCRVENNRTSFNTFAVNAKHVIVAIYDSWNSVRRIEYAMTEIEDHIWHVTIEENLSAKFYAYIVHRDEKKYIATDPYSYSLSVNSFKSAIIDPRVISSESFDCHKKPNIKYNEAVIYETHVRDFTSSTTISVNNKNKYLGLTESSTLETGEKIGFDHLKELGITHVHLLPVLDFVTVDEEDPSSYNWGYDPGSFFALEGSYSKHPEDPYSRIREFKEMVMFYHQNSIGVILDVVYNHTYHSLSSNFEVLAPGVFYRKNKDGSLSDGSGCGNEINTENPLVRRVICESLKHLLKTYKLDGFRFDLLGLMDRMTLYTIVKELRKIDPNVVIYGEPWVGGESMLENHKRVHKGTQRNKRFSVFNDDFRDALKGDNDGISTGYIQGNQSRLDAVKLGIMGSIRTKENNGFTAWPYESINYTCSHDNLILYDKISNSLAGISHEENLKINKLGFFLTLMSFGVPFIHGGTEFARTKHMDHNSYRSGDYINGINWSLKHQNTCLYEYVKSLIHLRKKMSFFSNYTKKDIEENFIWYYLPNGALGYEIHDKYENITYSYFINPMEITINTGFKTMEFKEVLCNSIDMTEYSTKNNDQNLLIISPRSSMILMKKT